jgi:hypothetical protein
MCCISMSAVQAISTLRSAAVPHWRLGVLIAR